MFWIKVDVEESGDVKVSTYSSGNVQHLRGDYMRCRKAKTVSQALRKLAAAMVTAKAEKIPEQQGRV